jgi:hypothetical protein
MHEQGLNSLLCFVVPQHIGLSCNGELLLQWVGSVEVVGWLAGRGGSWWGGGGGYQVHSVEKSFTVCCRDEAEKRSWMGAIAVPRPDLSSQHAAYVMPAQVTKLRRNALF